LVLYSRAHDQVIPLVPAEAGTQGNRSKLLRK
jgi:hypothetical protein